MAINIKKLPQEAKVKFNFLSKTDQKEVLNCKAIEEACKMIIEKYAGIPDDPDPYEPNLPVSGSSIKYKVKNLFTESFEEDDVRAFIRLAEESVNAEDELIFGELKRQMNIMFGKGRQPLQCMVYATKNNEKIFYNNEKKVDVWARAIAEAVNEDREYVLSMNHMLVNWSMWKYQIVLLISACTYIRQNEKLDEVIRDLYTDYYDDKVKFTVMKRLVHSSNLENYRSVFEILKKVDFINSETDKKYFNVLKKKYEYASEEEREKLRKAFKSAQFKPGIKRTRIENLLGINPPPPPTNIVERLNSSKPEEKDSILKEVHNKIYGSQKDYLEVARSAKHIKKYRAEIQKMFMEKLSNTRVNLGNIKTYGLAIGDLDSDGRAVAFLREQMSMCFEDSQKLMYAYILADISDVYINRFIENVLEYDGNADMNLMRNLGSGKNPIIRKCLYDNCIKIKDKYGLNSRQFRTALKNIGIFMQSGTTVAIYDTKFDQLLFDFLSYDKVSRTFDEKKCTVRKTELVLNILEKVMDQNNYRARYGKFMWDLNMVLRDLDKELADKILKIDNGFGGGIPTL